MCGGFIRKDNWDIPGNDLLSSPVQVSDYATQKKNGVLQNYFWFCSMYRTN